MIPTVTAEQMREVNRLMREEMEISLLQMMENAVATLTLALPKAGLLQPAARPWVGTLYVADISVPEVVYRRLGLSVGPLFAQADIVCIADGQEGVVR